MKKPYLLFLIFLLSILTFYTSGCSKSSGTSALPKIVRDSYGVAHIYAGSDYSLFYGVGWAEAQDRLVQMEFMRRDGEGTLSEILGTLALGSDITMHQLFYTKAEREQAFNSITDTTVKNEILAYVDGVNGYIQHIYSDSTFKDVPYEFFNLGGYLKSITYKYGLPGGATYRLLPADGGKYTVYEPGPWAPSDVMAITDMLVDFFGTGGGRQLKDLNDINVLKQWFMTKQNILDPTATTYAMQVFDDARWLNDPLAPTSIPDNTPGGTVITPNGPEKTTPAIPAGITVAPKSVSLGTLSLNRNAQKQYAFLFSIPSSSIRRAMDDFNGNWRKVIDMRKKLGIFFTEGSNAWAVAPTLTATNSAMIWGGPQEGFSVPNIDDEMYLHSPDITVGGMKIPGEPVILIGMTDHYGWTTTSGEIDNSEIYVEQIDTAASGFTTNSQTPNSNYSVWYKGSYTPMKRIVETIHYAGENPSATANYPDQQGNPGSGPMLYNVFRVNDAQHFHGPVISFDLANGLAYTYRVAFWKTEYSTIEGFAGMNTAKNWFDFNNAVAKVTSLHNFIYADQLGNISYWSTGSEPNFPNGYDDRLPSPGNGSAEWSPWPDGRMYLPYSNWLYTVNPPQGWFVNWNTKPLNVPGVIMEGNNGDEHWGQIYRSDRIAFLLKNNPNKRTVADMENIEKDVGTINGDQNVTVAGPYFIPFIVKAYNTLKTQNDPLITMTTTDFITQAVNILSKWNTYFTDTAKIFSSAGYSITPGVPGYSPVIGQPGAMIFAKWWENIQQVMFGNMFRGILGEVTYNMLLHILDYPSAGVPIRFTGTTSANYLTGLTTGSRYTQGSYYAFATMPASVPLDRDHIIIYALQQALIQLSQNHPASGSQFSAKYNSSDPATWGYIPVNDIDFDDMDSFASPANTILAGAGISPTNFGKAPSQNRSTYMQVINLTNPIFGENVLAPGENGFVQFNMDGTGTVGSDFGNQIDLFRAFMYKPMNLK